MWRSFNKNDKPCIKRGTNQRHVNDKTIYMSQTIFHSIKRIFKEYRVMARGGKYRVYVCFRNKCCNMANSILCGMAAATSRRMKSAVWQSERDKRNNITM